MFHRHRGVRGLLIVRFILPNVRGLTCSSTYVTLSSLVSCLVINDKS